MIHTNQSKHRDLVIQEQLDQIDLAKSQIKLEGIYDAWVDEFETKILITIETDGAPPIPITFSKTNEGLAKAAIHINQYVTVSPSGSSTDKEVTQQEVSA